ncbi:hypothetical protein HC723_16405 [Vibrio sp. S11_S32]|uniref:hypothetical protein n=1 Tax=Vibrio sp. S11_S32 TaxID=2720225 RepID=UPI0016809C59|nr:hypothetical protein [Vibrio sp. S11_S32]MBD1577972.1 hypothetical protein [Vibrio sp. S11_S32]
MDTQVSKSNFVFNDDTHEPAMFAGSSLAQSRKNNRNMVMSIEKKLFNIAKFYGITEQQITDKWSGVCVKKGDSVLWLVGNNTNELHKLSYLKQSGELINLISSLDSEDDVETYIVRVIAERGVIIQNLSNSNAALYVKRNFG